MPPKPASDEDGKWPDLQVLAIGMQDTEMELIARPLGAYLFRTSVQPTALILSFHSKQAAASGKYAAFSWGASGSSALKVMDQGQVKGKGGGGGGIFHLDITRTEDNQYILHQRPDDRYGSLNELVFSCPFLKHPKRDFSSTMFPNWLVKRQDFQNTFPRFNPKSDMEDVASLHALWNFRGYRTPEQVQLLVRWMKEHTSLDFAKVFTLCSVADHKSIKAGEILFERGSCADVFYMIFEGAVECIIDVGADTMQGSNVKLKAEGHGGLGGQIVGCLVCGQTAEFRCMQCSSVCYCSRACQRQDWTEHKRECELVKVEADAKAEKEAAATAKAAAIAKVVAEAKAKEEAEEMAKHFLVDEEEEEEEVVVELKPKRKPKAVTSPRALGTKLTTEQMETQMMLMTEKANAKPASPTSRSEPPRLLPRNKDFFVQFHHAGVVGEFDAHELERVVVELFKGDAFGESGLETQTKSTRSATVRALRDCHLVEVHKQDYLTSLLIYDKTRLRREMNWMAANCELLQEMTSHKLYKMAEASYAKLHKKKSVIYSQGNPASGTLYIVREGEVTLQKEVFEFSRERFPGSLMPRVEPRGDRYNWTEKQTASVRIVPIRVVREGECFGEEELLDYARCKALEAKRLSDGRYRFLNQTDNGIAEEGEKKLAEGATTKTKVSTKAGRSAAPEEVDDASKPLREFSAVATGPGGAVVMVIERADFSLLTHMAVQKLEEQHEKTVSSVGRIEREYNAFQTQNRILKQGGHRGPRLQQRDKAMRHKHMCKRHIVQGSYGALSSRKKVHSQKLPMISAEKVNAKVQDTIRFRAGTDVGKRAATAIGKSRSKSKAKDAPRDGEISLGGAATNPKRCTFSAAGTYGVKDIRIKTEKARVDGWGTLLDWEETLFETGGMFEGGDFDEQAEKSAVGSPGCIHGYRRSIDHTNLANSTSRLPSSNRTVPTATGQAPEPLSMSLPAFSPTDASATSGIAVQRKISSATRQSSPISGMAREASTTGGAMAYRRRVSRQSFSNPALLSRPGSSTISPVGGAMSLSSSQPGSARGRSSSPHGGIKPPPLNKARTMPALLEIDGDEDAASRAGQARGAGREKKSTGSDAFSRFGATKETMQSKMRRRGSVQGTPLSRQEALVTKQKRAAEKKEQEVQIDAALTRERTLGGGKMGQAKALSFSDKEQEEEFARRTERERVVEEAEKERAMQQLVAMGVYGYADTPPNSKRELRGFHPQPKTGSGKSPKSPKRAARVVKLDANKGVRQDMEKGLGTGHANKRSTLVDTKGRSTARARRITNIITRKATSETLQRMNNEKMEKQKELKMYLAPNASEEESNTHDWSNQAGLERMAKSMSSVRRMSALAMDTEEEALRI
jgi:CRP-like cAMP-binding protein